MKSAYLAGLALLAAASLALAQAQAVPAAPYAGQQARDIKALSAQEVDSLLAGKGMGLAKAAELNGYPGPLHVLELATQLDLTPEQRTRTQALFDAMADEARTLGRALVEQERRLDRVFADRSVTPQSLEGTLGDIAGLQAKVRGAHLEAHLAQMQILTSEQTARYMQLRGYRAAEHSADHGGHHKH